MFEALISRLHGEGLDFERLKSIFPILTRVAKRKWAPMKIAGLVKGR